MEVVAKQRIAALNAMKTSIIFFSESQLVHSENTETLDRHLSHASFAQHISELSGPYPLLQCSSNRNTFDCVMFNR